MAKQVGDLDMNNQTIVNPAAVETVAVTGDLFLFKDTTDGDVKGLDYKDFPSGNATALAIGQATKGEQLTVNEAETGLEFGLASKYLPVRKGSAGTIAKGTPCYLSGWNPSGFIEVETADSSDPAKMPAVGLSFDALTNGATGRVLMSGLMVDNLDTSGYTVDARLYVAAAAGANLPWLTATKPTTGAIQAIATVTRSNASNGTLVVHGASRANDVPNGYVIGTDIQPFDATLTQKSWSMAVFDSTEDCAVGDGTIGFCVPASMDALDITDCVASVHTAGTGGLMSIQIRRRRGATNADVLSTKLTFDTGETSSTTAATSHVINTANDDLNEGDMIYLDIDGVQTTAAKGLTVTITAEAP